MTRHVEVLAVGPAVTVQDLGRTGYLAAGLTRGGAMDRLALYEAAALLGQPPGAALEMIGMGGTFKVTMRTRVALTGAPMRADIDGKPVPWHGSHTLEAGQVLKIGGVQGGSIGYLSFGGGIETPALMGSQSAHLAAGLGAILSTGDVLALGVDRGGAEGLSLVPEDRFSGGEVAAVTSMQSHHFGQEALTRFGQTPFERDTRANRQGIRLIPKGEGFAAQGGLRVVSEIIVPGDVQVTGDGAPYVLMCESQTTGGYPRIASVVPADLPRVAQAPAGAELRFRLVSADEGIALEQSRRAAWRALSKQVRPRVRDPRDMSDLLSYTLVSGVIDALDAPLDRERT